MHLVGRQRANLQGLNGARPADHGSVYRAVTGLTGLRSAARGSSHQIFSTSDTRLQPATTHSAPLPAGCMHSHPHAHTRSLALYCTYSHTHPLLLSYSTLLPGNPTRHLASCISPAARPQLSQPLPKTPAPPCRQEPPYELRNTQDEPTTLLLQAAFPTCWRERDLSVSVSHS